MRTVIREGGLRLSVAEARETARQLRCEAREVRGLALWGEGQIGPTLRPSQSPEQVRGHWADAAALDRVADYILRIGTDAH